MDDDAIVVEGLEKSYGSVEALCGVDFTAPTGTVLGLLGPNGAGKTTAVRILATLLQPDGGTRPRRRARRRARRRRAARQDRPRRPVRGGRREPDRLREPRDGRPALPPAPRARRAQRADELLERFDLADAAKRPAKTYSGGMRRRLDLAAALVVRPPVLFLDEPTTGLDPRSRLGMWETIEARVAAGHDRPAHHAVPRRGRPARRPDRRHRPRQRDRRGHVRRAQGPRRRRAPRGPRSRTPPTPTRAIAALAEMADERPTLEDGVVRAPVRRAHRARSPRRSAASTTPASAIDDIALRRPTLDDVFIVAHRPRGRGGADAEASEEVRAHERARAVTSRTRSSSRGATSQRIPRQPDLLIAYTIQPVMFVLLFVYVFGGAIQTPGFDYVDFLMPGHHRPVDRVRRVRDRARAVRGRQEGPDRPLPLAADVARRGARRAHVLRRRAQLPVARRAARASASSPASTSSTRASARSSLGHRPAAAARLRVLVDLRAGRAVLVDRRRPRTRSASR